MSMNRQTLQILVVLIFGIGGGLIVYDTLFGLAGPQTTEAVAPTLEAQTADRIVYRIDPAQSEVTYSIQEYFAGRPVSTAIGTTSTLAGDILLDTNDYAASEVGTIVINVEHFTSDSGLRDGRIRKEFLQSSTYPEATFIPTSLSDFPAEIVQGQEVTFHMTGDLTVRTTTQSATWTVTATLAGDTLTGTATTTVLMSDYGIGPISIAGLVETEDEVALTFRFMALRVAEA